MIVHSALEGLKVADFSWAAAGPIATRMLADHGATVVRVESRAHIDSVRITGPFRNDERGVNRSGFFADFNSSKYSLALNMQRPEALPVARRLIEWSDVVVESFTPRVMRGWGIGYDQIAVWKPDAILLSSCMQGQTGPYRDYSGFGNQGAAMAGIHSVTGWPDRIPAGPKGAYTDAIAPRYTIAAILAAVDYRDRTGIGQYIDLSQVEAAIGGFFATEVLDYTVNGRRAVPAGNRSRTAAPYGAFPCAGEDEWITIGIESNDHWRALCAAMGDPAWAASAELEKASGRLGQQDRIEESVAAWTRGWDAFALLAELQARGVPSGVVQKAKDLFADPQVAHRGHFRSLDHVEMGSVDYNGPAHELSETPAVLRWAAPLLGEHTEHVLQTFLGYDESDIKSMTAGGLLA